MTIRRTIMRRITQRRKKEDIKGGHQEGGFKKGR
jgi:hypothetical protein